MTRIVYKGTDPLRIKLFKLFEEHPRTPDREVEIQKEIKELTLQIKERDAKAAAEGKTEA